MAALSPRATIATSSFIVRVANDSAVALALSKRPGTKSILFERRFSTKTLPPFSSPAIVFARVGGAASHCLRPLNKKEFSDGRGVQKLRRLFRFMKTINSVPLLAVLALIATITALGLSGCATGRGGEDGREEDANKYQGGLGFDVSHIERAATNVVESLAKVPEFADPTLQPWILVELDKVEVTNRRLVTDAGTLVRRFVTYAMKVQARSANFISVEDYKKAEEWRKRIQSGTVTGGSDDPNILNYRSPDFLLEVTISDATQTNPSGKRVIYMLYSFRLTDRRTLRLVWQEDFKSVTSAKPDSAYQ